MHECAASLLWINNGLRTEWQRFYIKLYIHILSHVATGWNLSSHLAVLSSPPTSSLSLAVKLGVTYALWGLLACSLRPFIFYMTAWWEPNSPGDTTTGSLQTNERHYLPEELSVIMAVLTGRSLGVKKKQKKHTDDDGLGNNVARKRWLWKGLSTASIEEAHYCGSQGKYGHWGRQQWTKLRKNGWRRREKELNQGMEETDGVGRDGSTESGRHAARQEGVRWEMGPDVRRECWKDG